ncbi:MAG TPA: sigma-54 dependent transcriptional regulator [Polyangia bacterium]|nr:sigma-54 dependent transcriptional regulator [Polyangia bacterium]
MTTPALPATGRILIVDDEAGVRTFLADALVGAGHDVTQAPDGDAALARLGERAFHLVITDLRMPGVDGMDLLRAVRRDHPEVEIIVLTAHGSIENAVEAMKEGAFDYLQKPVGSPTELRLLVARALERRRLRAIRDIAAGGAEPPLGYGAPAMRAVEAALRKVAATNATVLLLGESGSGKEVAARAVHRWSARAAGPFVAVNCAALATELLESELFGHEKGAFTGAHARQLGRIELADGGTFFLDEIGELAPGLQAKLLRVLQERRFERVGGRQTVEADVRWIAATNRDLPALIARGGFREDLYHRVAVFPVEMPPLRARREDIPPLADRLLVRIAGALGRPELRLTDDARQVLAAAAWPGNVRELANVLERSAILADAPAIGADDLALLPGGDGAAAGGTAPTTMTELERDAIERALAATGGNRRLAAARLGIGLRTLYEKLKRYGLP